MFMSHYATEVCKCPIKMLPLCRNYPRRMVTPDIETSTSTAAELRTTGLQIALHATQSPIALKFRSFSMFA